MVEYGVMGRKEIGKKKQYSSISNNFISQISCRLDHNNLGIKNLCQLIRNR